MAAVRVAQLRVALVVQAVAVAMAVLAVRLHHLVKVLLVAGLRAVRKLALVEVVVLVQ
jgi:hypothetical protein